MQQSRIATLSRWYCRLALASSFVGLAGCGTDGDAGPESGGAGGSPTSTGGSPGSTGGSPGSTGGSPGSTGGSPGSTGGSPSDTGGSPSDTGGSPSDTGGSPSDTGGSPSDTGGSPGSTGGSGGLECDSTELLRRVQGSTEDDEIAFTLDRCMPQLCAGGCPVTDVYFTLRYQNRTDEATSDRISYTATHHNWDDSLVATLPDRRTTWRVAVTPVDGELKFTHFVAAEALDGTPLLAETAIVLDSL